ncbi:MAG TPA: hypothetical protein VIK86_00825 [Candidatus Paceibacterota bacterium]
MKLIFCISNLSVPVTISLVENENEDFVIFTDQLNLVIFFSKLYGNDRVIFCENFKIKGKIQHLLFFPFLILFKHNLWKKFQNYSGCKVYFFFNAFGFKESWLIKKLSKKNLIFYQPDIDMSSFTQILNVKSIIGMLMIFCNYNVITEPKYSNTNIYYSVSKKFIHQTKTELIDIKINKEAIKRTISQHFDVSKRKIIYLIGDVVESKYIDEKEYILKNDLLLAKFNKDETILKIHPRYTKIYSKENEFGMLPSYIPANVLIEHFEIVIAYSSSVLFEFANNGITAISLLNYFEPTSQSIKSDFIQYLKHNTVEERMIYYPKNTDEIYGIINSETKQIDHVSNKA